MRKTTRLFVACSIGAIAVIAAAWLSLSSAVVFEHDNRSTSSKTDEMRPIRVLDDVIRSGQDVAGVSEWLRTRLQDHELSNRDPAMFFVDLQSMVRGRPQSERRLMLSVLKPAIMELHPQEHSQYIADYVLCACLYGDTADAVEIADRFLQLPEGMIPRDARLNILRIVVDFGSMSDRSREYYAEELWNLLKPDFEAGILAQSEVSRLWTYSAYLTRVGRVGEQIDLSLRSVEKVPSVRADPAQVFSKMRSAGFTTASVLGDPELGVRRLQAAIALIPEADMTWTKAKILAFIIERSPVQSALTYWPNLPPSATAQIAASEVYLAGQLASQVRIAGRGEELVRYAEAVWQRRDALVPMVHSSIDQGSADAQVPSSGFVVAELCFQAALCARSSEDQREWYRRGLQADPMHPSANAVRASLFR